MEWGPDTVLEQDLLQDALFPLSTEERSNNKEIILAKHCILIYLIKTVSQLSNIIKNKVGWNFDKAQHGLNKANKKFKKTHHGSEKHKWSTNKEWINQNTT